MSKCDFDILFARYVPNIHEKIFFSLDYESFKSCLEVSKSWNDLLKSESFMKKAKTKFCKDMRDEVVLAAKEGMVNKLRAVISTFMVDVNFITEIDGTEDPSQGASPLILASERGHKDVVQLLLTSGADPNLADEDGFTPLIDAVDDGHFEVAKLLLDYGADPNLANKIDGYVPLMYASLSGFMDIVKLLLDRGADPNLKGDTGDTALSNAVDRGHKDIAKLLLDRGADPDIPDSHGNTPLHNAVKKNHKDLVQLLLDRGAKLNIEDRYGKTPKDYALQKCCKGREGIALIIESYAMLDQLSNALPIREE